MLEIDPTVPPYSSCTFNLPLVCGLCAVVCWDFEFFQNSPCLWVLCCSVQRLWIFSKFLCVTCPLVCAAVFSHCFTVSRVYSIDCSFRLLLQSKLLWYIVKFIFVMEKQDPQDTKSETKTTWVSEKRKKTSVPKQKTLNGAQKKPVQWPSTPPAIQYRRGRKRVNIVDTSIILSKRVKLNPENSHTS